MYCIRIKKTIQYFGLDKKNWKETFPKDLKNQPVRVDQVKKISQINLKASPVHFQVLPTISHLKVAVAWIMMKMSHKNHNKVKVVGNLSK